MWQWIPTLASHEKPFEELDNFKMPTVPFLSEVLGMGHTNQCVSKAP